MNLLIPIGLAAAAFLALQKGESQPSEEEVYMGYATAYAYLDEQPKPDVPFVVDLKSMTGKAPGPTKVRPVLPVRDVEFPDGRKGRAMLGGISDENGHPIGAVTLYFL